jgi:glycogen(starch) synthase
VVLQAAPEVLVAVPGAKFVFIGRTVGDPAAPSSAESLGSEAQRLGIGDAVELPGGLDWQGVADELRRASVCVFPSRWECFPNVAGEASAMGRPVVVSSIPGFQELVQDGVTGMMVGGDDAQNWARAIAGLLLDRDRARALGQAGSRLVRQISDPGRIASQTIAAYEHAIDRWREGRHAGSGGGHQAWLGLGARRHRPQSSL